MPRGRKVFHERGTTAKMLRLSHSLERRWKIEAELSDRSLDHSLATSMETVCGKVSILIGWPLMTNTHWQLYCRYGR